MIKTVIYIKNRDFEINEIISYERLKNEKFSFKHMEPIETRI